MPPCPPGLPEEVVVTALILREGGVSRGGGISGRALARHVGPGKCVMCLENGKAYGHAWSRLPFWEGARRREAVRGQTILRPHVPAVMD